jgi:hypothetical protein
VRQLAAAFDCQFIANLAEMSSSQRRKQAFSFKFTRNIRQTIQGGSKLPHSKAPSARDQKLCGIWRLAGAPSRFIS